MPSREMIYKHELFYNNTSEELTPTALFLPFPNCNEFFIIFHLIPCRFTLADNMIYCSLSHGEIAIS